MIISEQLVFLSIALLLGIFTSYTDIKQAKIYNKHILWFFILSFFVYLFFFKEIIPHLSTIVSNLVISLLLGYFLWDFGLWTAGDGKLFTLFSFIIPVTTYNSILFFYPSFHFLVNSFAPIFLFLLFFAIIKTTTKQKIKHLRSLKILRLAEMFLSFYSLFLFVGIAYIKFPAFLPFMFLFLIVFYFLIKLFFARYSILAFIFLGAVLSFFKAPSINIILLSIVLAIVYFLLRFLLWDMGKELFTTPKNANQLKKGEVIAKFSIPTFFYDESPFYKGSEPLTQEHIDKLVSFGGTEQIRVHQTIPFAPFLFFGAVISFLIKSNIIIYLWGLFS